MVGCIGLFFQISGHRYCRNSRSVVDFLYCKCVRCVFSITVFFTKMLTLLVDTYRISEMLFKASYRMHMTVYCQSDKIKANRTI